MLGAVAANDTQLISGIRELSTSAYVPQQLDCFGFLDAAAPKQECDSETIPLLPEFYSEGGSQDSLGQVCQSLTKVKTVSVDSGACSIGDETEAKFVELETISSKPVPKKQLTTHPQKPGQYDMTLGKDDMFQAYPSNKMSTQQAFGLCNDASILELEATISDTGGCDSTDSMFDDAFSLDEFMFSQREWWSSKGSQAARPYSAANLQSQSGQRGTMADTAVRTVSSQDALTHRHPTGFRTTETCDDSKLRAELVLQSQTIPPSFQDIRHRTFSDLLRAEEGPSQQCYQLSDRNRSRDYSFSSDSGMGGSIFMDSASSLNTSSQANDAPFDHLNAGSSTDLDQCSRPSKHERTGTLRYLSSTSDTSRNPSGDKQSSDFSIESIQQSVGGGSPPEPAKVSSKKTAYNEKWGVKVLKAWCVEVNISEDFEQLEPEGLNDMLCRFWSEVRKTNGDYYGRNSLFNLRAMINKHLKGKPHFAQFDIVTDERFRSSNDRLEKQLKVLKGIGKTITHKQPISIADLRRMYDSNVLGTENPLSLLRKVWFEITLHFCHKGSEPQEKLSRTTFRICRDHNYRAYISRAPRGHSDDSDEVRMYETGGQLCPVRSYQLYLQKLHPLQTRLFQQPRRKSTPASPMWYGKAPIGEKALQQMMANISVAAKLSKRYTNHCVRTTALEQFSNSRRKTGGKGSNDKASNKACSRSVGVAILKDIHPSSCFQSNTEPKQQSYHTPGMSEYGCQQQTPYLASGVEHYLCNMPNPASCHYKNVPLRGENQNNAQRISSMRTYKRYAQEAFEDGHDGAGDGRQDLPPLYTAQPGPKRPRLEHCQAILADASTRAPDRIYSGPYFRSNSEHTFGDFNGSAAYSGGVSLIANDSPRKGFSDNVASALNTDSAPDQSFALLPNFA